LTVLEKQNDEPLGPHSRAAAIEQVTAREAARKNQRAVAGFDFTLSIPKSVSVLWAVVDAGTRVLIAEAHHVGVADVVAFLEREVAATRVGINGVAHLDTRGVIATGLDHRDSRACDPHLHTHIVIANRVQSIRTA
jgi:conjugative relaxase-like TrwC/TraI family protein